MITRAPAFVTEDGKSFTTLEDAQRHEIAGLLGLDVNEGIEKAVLDRIMEKLELLSDILTTTATSKPKARKVNGGTKKRKPSAEAINLELQEKS